MKKIIHIDGLAVEVIKDQRIVTYLGQECPLIKRTENLCEQDTSYFGCLLDSWETYQTPVGIVERHYWARGAGLDQTGVDWRIIPVEEIEDIQKRFSKASIELAEAREALEKVTLVSV